MKMLITSPDAIIDYTTKKPFAGIINALDDFNKDENHKIAVVSIHQRKLLNIPDRYNQLVRNCYSNRNEYKVWYYAYCKLLHRTKKDTNDIRVK